MIIDQLNNLKYKYFCRKTYRFYNLDYFSIIIKNKKQLSVSKVLSNKILTRQNVILENGLL